MFSILRSWLSPLRYDLATFFFENSCCCFLETLFRDRHYKIINWRKRHMEMGGHGGDLNGPHFEAWTRSESTSPNPAWSPPGGGAGSQSPLRKFFPPWKNVLDIVWKYCTDFKNVEPLSETLRPSWFPKLVTGLIPTFTFEAQFRPWKQPNLTCDSRYAQLRDSGGLAK